MSEKSKILVVDDDEAFVDAVSKVLDHHGWTVSANNSGVAGLAEFEALLRENGHPPQVAIIDLRMPDLKGTDLAKRIKQLAPEVYTILVSGYLNGEPEAGVAAVTAHRVAHRGEPASSCARAHQITDPLLVCAEVAHLGVVHLLHDLPGAREVSGVDQERQEAG